MPTPPSQPSTPPMLEPTTPLSPPHQKLLRSQPDQTCQINQLPSINTPWTLYTKRQKQAEPGLPT